MRRDTLLGSTSICRSMANQLLRNTRDSWPQTSSRRPMSRLL
jgi:hypothetical protein